MSTSNRRSFLQALGKRAARDAREVVQVAGPLLGTTPAGMVRAALATRTPDEEPALEPTRRIDRDEVLALIQGEGLGHREDEVAALVRPALRLRPLGPADGLAAAWVDPAAIDTQAPLAQVDGSAEELNGTPLAGDGWCELTAAQDGDVAVIVLDSAPSLAASMRPMGIDAHLTLPPSWTRAVQGLHLTGFDHDAYLSLRERLADAQGFDIDPATEPARDPEADWRLLVELRTDAGRLSIWTADEGLDRLVGIIR